MRSSPCKGAASLRNPHGRKHSGVGEVFGADALAGALIREFRENRVKTSGACWRHTLNLTHYKCWSFSFQLHLYGGLVEEAR